MKKLALTIAVLALATPAFADDAAEANDTITHMIANGAVVSAQGAEYVLSFEADGSFADDAGMVAGTWKATGNQHCLSIPGMIDDMCSEYPDGKTAGDTFDIETEMGPMTVTLN